MNLVWEDELSYTLGFGGDHIIHTLKYTIPNETASKGWIGIGVAYVVKRGERKWEAFFPAYSASNDKTFRTLKAAKAYAVAIVQLER